ncbi:hypothetical protein CAEBREN_31978 [Caenorhabditis brenneri]|uniref:Uncharacterized protein n=1 Tax=Caenorhabditis brenneri TaxID=135651 RepID=G0P283_CAEBE|nr:hypothetical protein CAEBREN_31978 [Caenorhabditis brenneri]
MSSSTFYSGFIRKFTEVFGMDEAKSSETDVESAYGSETVSGSQFTIGKHRFTLQNEKKKCVWYERWESRIRDHLVIEGLLMLILFGVFVTYIRLDSRNEETQFMVV